MTATSAAQMPVRFTRIPALDGVRAIAVLLVMGFHAGLPGFRGGKAGVDVFFALSGFLITALLLDEHRRNGHIRLRAFYMRRALRLYPALIATIVVAIALAAVRIPLFDASAGALRSTIKGTPFALFYSMNITRALGVSGGGYLGHTWSLAIEEQFYLVWPLVAVALLSRAGRVRRLGWIAAGCALASNLTRAALDLSGYDSEMLYNATFSHVDGIFAGCALAVLWHVRGGRTRLPSHRAVLALTTVAAAVVVVRGEHMNEYGFTVVIAATLLAVADLASDPASRLTAALSRPALVAIGKRSYGLYLYHWPIFLFLGIDTRLHVLALAFGGSFAAAWLSFRWIEQPFLRVKRRWDSDRATTLGGAGHTTDSTGVDSGGIDSTGVDSGGVGA